jgi:hypothetical protein
VRGHGPLRGGVIRARPALLDLHQPRVDQFEAAGRRQRALAEWAGAAGFGLVAWGLGTEAPTAAEVQENFRRHLDLMRKPGTQAPVTAGTETPAARRVSRFFRRWELVSPVAWMVIDVPWRLRHPRRLTVLTIAMEAPNAVYGSDASRSAAKLSVPPSQ